MKQAEDRTGPQWLRRKLAIQQPSRPVKLRSRTGSVSLTSLPELVSSTAFKRVRPAKLAVSPVKRHDRAQKQKKQVLTRC